MNEDALQTTAVWQITPSQKGFFHFTFETSVSNFVKIC